MIKKNLNYQTGKFGEMIAGDFLKKAGYQIIKTNFRTRYGEIDLVAAKDQRLVFTEVKLKVGDYFGPPEEMVDRYKLIRIKKMAEYFLQIYPKLASSYPQYRIDTICIVLNQDRSIKRISHWEDIGNEMA